MFIHSVEFRVASRVVKITRIFRHDFLPFETARASFRAINKKCSQLFFCRFHGSLSRPPSLTHARYVLALLLFINYPSSSGSLWCPVTCVNKSHESMRFSRLTSACTCTCLCLCRCKPGFYNLGEVNPEGCQACFCFGHSRACSSSAHHVAVNVTSDFMEGKNRDTCLPSQRPEQGRSAGS